MNSLSKDIFAQAYELDDEAREAFLTEACGDDAELRLDVQRLLLKAEKVDSFFANDEGDTIGAEEFDGDEAISEQEGDQVGPYILRQKIGEGGFGVVWMAEQCEPISRMVALKVIKAGMDTKQVLARFEAERQALAMMDHQNIAKVLDAGATPAGRPYFAMELVKGIPITEFCREQKLNTQERLALFQDVCSAVNHAHQKGIIHRDLKPSNVMVTLAADKPVAKVIDFGIAKATQNKLTEKTLFTRFEQFLGTPVYMSPEQAAMSSLDIDTRSDIYSLGVLLYELLAGQPPFDSKTLLSAGYDEMRRIIKEDEPPKPSTRLTQTQASASRTDPYITPKALRGELDWIVMKAIEKDRSRRYETPNAFAADIGRYLEDEPVQAAAPSLGYKFRKFARRNKVALSVGTLITLVMLGATTVSLWQARRATTASLEAEAVSEFLTQMFEGAQPGNDKGGREVKVAEILDQATEKLRKDSDYPPERRAKLQETLAKTYHALGLDAEALRLRREVFEFHSQNHGASHRDTLGAKMELAEAHAELGEFPKALTLNEEALTLSREVHGAEDPLTLDLMRSRLGIASDSGLLGDDYLALAEELVSLSNNTHGETSMEFIQAKHFLAHVYQGERAHELHREVVELSREVLGDTAETTLWSMKCLGISFHKRSQSGEAIRLGKELVRLTSEAKSRKHPDTLKAMTYLAQWQSSAGQYQEATTLLEEALDLSRTELGEEHPATLTAMHNLAAFYSQSGDNDRAIEMQKKVLALRLEAHPDHDNTLKAKNSLAVFYTEAGQVKKAIEILEEVLAVRGKQIGLDTSASEEALTTMNNLANAYEKVHRLNEALEMRETVSELRLKDHPNHPNTLKAVSNLAKSHTDTGQPAFAISLLEKELARRRERSSDFEDDPAAIPPLINLASAYSKNKQLDKALEIREEAHDLATKTLDPTHPLLQEVKLQLGLSYRAAGKDDQEIQMLTEVLTIRVEKWGWAHPETLWSYRILVRHAYPEKNRHVDAIKLRERALRGVLAVRAAETTPNSEDSFKALNWLIGSYTRAGRLEEMLEICGEVLSDEHADTLQVMQHLAVFEERAGNHHKALALRKERLDLCQTVFGLDHRNTLGAMTNLAISYREAERFDEAIELQEESLEIKRRVLRPNDRFIFIAMDHLAKCYDNVERSADAKALREQLAVLTQPQNAMPKPLAVLVPPDSTWQWLHPNDGVDPAGADSDFHTTFSTSEYDDTSWQTGKDSKGPTGGFGYGDSAGVNIDASNEPQGKTAYFRHQFTTGKAHSNLELRCQRDDGIIVYLDGTEVARNNMSEGEEAYRLSAKLAVGNADEKRVNPIPLKGELEPGEHVLAISLHNTAAPSSDLRIAGITLVEVAVTAANPASPQD